MEFCVSSLIHREAAGWKKGNLCRPPQTPSPMSRYAQPKYFFLDKRCESFFSCSLSVDSSLCSGRGSSSSFLEFKRSAPTRRQPARAQKGLSQT